MLDGDRRFPNRPGVTFSWVLTTITGSWMSRAHAIVIPENTLDLAMPLILTPMILHRVDC